jgi:hypothetical protein
MVGVSRIQPFQKGSDAMMNVAAENSGGIEIAAACEKCWPRLDQERWEDCGASPFHSKNRKCDFCEMYWQMPARCMDLRNKGLYFVR